MLIRSLSNMSIANSYEMKVIGSRIFYVCPPAFEKILDKSFFLIDFFIFSCDKAFSDLFVCWIPHLESGYVPHDISCRGKVFKILCHNLCSACCISRCWKETKVCIMGKEIMLYLIIQALFLSEYVTARFVGSFNVKPLDAILYKGKILLLK